MLRDLAIETPDAPLGADILVIGAGIAGLLAATRLSARGLRVVVLESGGRSQAGETHPLNEVVQLGRIYGGAEHGRFRGLGGTSSRWGGAMLPFLAADMDGGRGPDFRWPVARDALLAYLPEVEAIFGLLPGPYEESDLLRPADGGQADFIPRFAKWPSFSKRNLATLLRQPIDAADGAEFWLNATATGFSFQPDGRLASVQATAPGGQTISVAAREIIVAAGAIESTRLLLLADRAANGRILGRDDVIGRYFHDHLSVRVADVAAPDPAALNRVAGFRFHGSGMRNLRFEPAAPPGSDPERTAGCLHISFVPKAATGLDALRDIYRAAQRRNRIKAGQVADLARSAPWLARAIWWRYRHQRLLYPANADVGLHAIVEQTPLASSRITLSEGKNDSYGQPLAAIDWQIDPGDGERLLRMAARFGAAWKGSNLGPLADLEFDPAETVLDRLDSFGGIYHPGGTTRMGTSAADGVVDGDLGVFRVPNLSVAATSTFPSGGGANPTMMLMMATLRLADHVGKRLGRA